MKSGKAINAVLLRVLAKVIRIFRQIFNEFYITP